MPLRWILPVGLALLGLLFVVSSLRDGVRSAAGPAPADVDPLRGLAELLFRAFVEESYRRLELRDPDTLISNELAQVYGVEERGRWSRRSPDYLEETYALERRTLAMPYARDRETLGPEERSTDDVYERYLADRVRWHSFTNVGCCSTPLRPPERRSRFPDLASDRERRGRGGVRRASLRVRHVEGPGPRGFRLRAESGALRRGFFFGRLWGRSSSSCRRTKRACDKPRSRRCESFHDRLGGSGFAEPEIERWVAVAEREVSRVVIPAFAGLGGCLAELQDCADDTLTAKRLREGEAFYAVSLHHHTTSEGSPARIHERACAEVDRILEERRAAAARLGWPEDLTAAEMDQRITEASSPIEGDALLPERRAVSPSPANPAATRWECGRSVTPASARWTGWATRSTFVSSTASFSRPAGCRSGSSTGA